MVEIEGEGGTAVLAGSFPFRCGESWDAGRGSKLVGAAIIYQSEQVATCTGKQMWQIK